MATARRPISSGAQHFLRDFTQSRKFRCSGPPPLGDVGGLNRWISLAPIWESRIEAGWAFKSFAQLRVSIQPWSPSNRTYELPEMISMVTPLAYLYLQWYFVAVL